MLGRAIVCKTPVPHPNPPELMRYLEALAPELLSAWRAAGRYSIQRVRLYRY